MSSSRERLGSMHHRRVSQGMSTSGSSSFRHQETASDHRHHRDHRVSQSDVLESKIAARAAEIDRLTGDNRKVAESYKALNEDLARADHEVQTLRAHIRKIETDSDIQIRVMLEKIVKMEGIIKNSENIRSDLQSAHIAAHRLAREREDLATKVKSTVKELKNFCLEAEGLEASTQELELLKEEHQTLREKFGEEKSGNIAKVERLKEMEKTIIAAVKEIEKLRSEIATARSKAVQN